MSRWIWAAGVVSLLAFGQYGECMVVAKGLTKEGLTLVPATSPEAQQLLPKTIGKQHPPSVDALLPYSAMLINGTKKRLVFYSVRWTSTTPGGATKHDDRMYYNLSTLRGGYAVAAGGNCLVSFLDALNKPLRGEELDEFNRKFQQSRVDLEFKQQSNLVITLDLAIFSDGEVVGPNLSGSLMHARVRLDAAREIDAKYEEGRLQRQPVSAFVSYLRDLENTSLSALGEPAQRWQLTYQKQLATELLQVYAHGGDNALRDRLIQCFRPSLKLSRQ